MHLSHLSKYRPVFRGGAAIALAGGALSAFGQSFGYTVQIPGTGTPASQEAAKLATPLVANGADPKTNTAFTPRYALAGERTSKGYSYTGELEIADIGPVFRLRYPVFNLSDGKVYESRLYRQGDSWVRMEPGSATVTLKDPGSPHWTPFHRFALLGQRWDGQATTARRGSFEAMKGEVKYRIAWQPQGPTETLITSHAITGVRPPTLMGRAVVANDRSSGRLERFSGADTLRSVESFRRLSAAPVSLERVDLPKGMRVVDLRSPARDGGQRSYAWSGDLPTRAALAEGAGDPGDGLRPLKIGLPVAGIALVAFALWRRRR